MVDSNKIIQSIDITMPEPLLVQNLEPGHELRINRIKDHIKIVLVSGQAEVFGRELPLTEPIFFNHGEEIAIFCWKQSQIKISGEHDSYTSEQTPMHIYVNINFALN